MISSFKHFSNMLFVLFFIFYVNASSCDLCIETAISITVDTLNYIPNETFNNIEILCNNTFYDNNDILMCIDTSLQYINDIKKDLNSEYEHANDIVVLSTERLCNIISACSVRCCISNWNPEEIHLSSTGSPTEMSVSWVTYKLLDNPLVEYWKISDEGSSNFTIYTQYANTSTYTDGGWEGTIYNCTLTNLETSTAYRYRISGESNGPYYVQEVEHHFITDMLPSSAPLKSRSLSNTSDPYIPGVSASVIAFCGDMSTTEKAYETTASLIRLAQNKSVQMVIHGGDLAYADGSEELWDKYFRMISPYSNSIPVMSAPGNHENYYNFAAYNTRYFNPYMQSGSTSTQYYSFNYEKIHFICWSFEQDEGADLLPGGKQRKWLENDLAQANLERNVRPWVVLFGHRPFYCSSDSHDCEDVAIYIRSLLEELINDYHVDVVLQAHKHNYERTYPVYRNELVQSNYNNPDAPMYYVVGTGGRDKNSDFIADQPDWSAYRDDTYGYVLLSAPNALELQMVYLSKSFNVHDSATITRTENITNWSFN